jgi:hypothetical protein
VNTAFYGQKYCIFGRSRAAEDMAETVLKDVRNGFVDIQMEKEG